MYRGISLGYRHCVVDPLIAAGVRTTFGCTALVLQNQGEPNRPEEETLAPTETEAPEESRPSHFEGSFINALIKKTRPTGPKPVAFFF